MSDAPDRRGFIGGSDAPAVLGISPWRSPLDLYLEKIADEVPPDDLTNAVAKRRGSRLEPYICDMLEEEGIKLAVRNEQLTDSEFPFLRAQIDAVTVAGENVEIKTVHPFGAKDWGEELTDSIPIHYTAQAMHGLMVSKRDRTIFAVMIGDDLRIYKVDRDVETITGMREREVKFWNEHVLARMPPQALTSSDVLTLFARDIGTTIEASPELAQLAANVRGLKNEVKDLEQAIGDGELALKLHMQNAANLTYQGKILATFKSQTANRLDQKLLAEDLPEIVEQYKRLNEYRVLRIK